MTPRMNIFAAAPEAMKAMMAVETAIAQSGLEHSLLELVKLRASQINGCAFCIDTHTRDLLKTMAVDKVVLVPVWHEVPHLFSDQYRAALAWAEEVTNVSRTHALDEAYSAAAEAFDSKDLVDLTLVIAAMNGISQRRRCFWLRATAAS